jgi:hypothetical protein
MKVGVRSVERDKSPWKQRTKSEGVKKSIGAVLILETEERKKGRTQQALGEEIFSSRYTEADNAKRKTFSARSACERQEEEDIRTEVEKGEVRPLPDSGQHLAYIEVQPIRRKPLPTTSDYLHPSLLAASRGRFPSFRSERSKGSIRVLISESYPRPPPPAPLPWRENKLPLSKTEGGEGEREREREREMKKP